MAEFLAPSFSLGLDFDLDSDLLTGGGGDDDDKPEEPPPPPILRSESPINGVTFPQLFHQQEVEGDDGKEYFNLQTLDEDPPPPAPVLKRLRRGLPSRFVHTPPAASRGRGELRLQPPNADDDIEEFSSQEDYCVRVPEERASIQSRSACSSSKVSLHGHGVLTQSASKSKDAKIKPVSSALTSTSVEASSNKKIFPKLTISPLRKIQLIDSDSDDLSISEDKNEGVKEVDSCLKKRQFAPFQSVTGNQQKKAKNSSNNPTESFWRDFSPKKNINLATPALDDFCEEYYRSVKGPNVGQHKEGNMIFTHSSALDPDDYVDRVDNGYRENSISNNQEHYWNLPDPQPPAYHYFYHDDIRIRKLVKDRLPNFSPLGAVNTRGNQLSVTGLDYMSQFGTREVPNQVHGAGKMGLERSSKSRKKNTKNANAEEVSQASGSWMNPRSSVTIPKDAGKRRVSAEVDGRSSGHWFTGQDGKKVYVNKNGQELSGRIAYRHYRKESGTGFRKLRKNATSGKKKAATGKKKTATGKNKKPKR